MMQYDPYGTLSNSPELLHRISESVSVYKQNCGLVRFVCPAIETENVEQALFVTTAAPMEGTGLDVEKQILLEVSEQVIALIQ